MSPASIAIAALTASTQMATAAALYDAAFVAPEQRGVFAATGRCAAVTAVAEALKLTKVAEAATRSMSAAVTITQQGAIAVAGTSSSPEAEAAALFATIGDMESAAAAAGRAHDAAAPGAPASSELLRQRAGKAMESAEVALILARDAAMREPRSPNSLVVSALIVAAINASDPMVAADIAAAAATFAMLSKEAV